MTLQALRDGHDQGHLRAMLQLIPRGGWCIEAGAHRGIWTKQLLEHFDAVFAFEPNPELFAQLCKDVPRARAMNFALDNVTGPVMMKRGTQNDGQSHLCPDDDGEFEVYAVTLDMQRWICPVRFIKLDVEGAEYFAIDGARQTILEHRPFVMIEQNGLDVQHFGLRKDAAIDLLVELGMKEVGRWNKDHLFGW